MIVQGKLPSGILPSNQSLMIEQVRFTYSLLKNENVLKF